MRHNSHFWVARPPSAGQIEQARYVDHVSFQTRLREYQVRKGG